jgi:NAD(P)-dependent dehydrogenase (short-subunit alcohol dehydrogenase family)
MRACVVTGAAAGIGRATTLRLLSDGWAVAAVDVDRERLNELVAEATSPVTPIVGDVADRSTSVLAKNTAMKLGDLAGWVNNAGLDIPNGAHEIESNDTSRLLDVNLVGVLWGCAEATKHFLERGGGSIVSVSSIQAVAGFPKSFVYAATKGGINALTRQLAAEYGPFGIRANAVMPGTIRTPMAIESWKRASDPQEAERADIRLHPLRRLGTPQEVASLIAFLLSDEASFISGQSIAVDGAATARCDAYEPDPGLVERFGMQGELGSTAAHVPTGE